MTWIKWWKNKDYCLLLLVVLLIMLGSFLSAKFIIYPMNLIIVLLLCALGGYILKKKMTKIIVNILESKHKDKLG